MKSIIKLFYVIILPLAVSVSGISYLMNSNDPSYIAVAVLVLAVIFNAVFWNVHWDKTSLIPVVNFEWAPIVGFALGVDYGYKRDPSLMIVIPFMTFDIKRRKK